MANEKRLIDANYFVNKGIRNCPIEEGGIPLRDFHQHQKILALYPTVDAVEVVHGRWEYGRWEKGHWVKGNERCRCSVCHRDFAVDNLNIWNGCPHCLAKMDGDGNGTA